MEAKISQAAADELIAKIRPNDDYIVRENVIKAINSMVEPEPAPKFPIGTRVQINPEVGKTIKKNIRGWNNSWNSLKMDEYIGMIGEIIEINWMGYRLKFLDGECWSFHESHLLPVPPEPVQAPEDLDIESYNSEDLEKVLKAFKGLILKYTDKESYEKEYPKGHLFWNCPLCFYFRNGDGCNNCPNATHSVWNCNRGIRNHWLKSILQGNSNVVSRRVAYLRRQIERIEEYMATKKTEPEFEVGDWVQHENCQAIYPISEIKINKAFLSGLGEWAYFPQIKKVHVQLLGEKPAQVKWAKTKLEMP